MPKVTQQEVAEEGFEFRHTDLRVYEVKII